jgi:hypothetical protein
MANLLFGYRLKQADKSTALAGSMKAASYGSDSDQARLYYLELYAKREAGDTGGTIRLDGFDVQLGFSDTILASLNKQLQTSAEGVTPATDARPAAIDIASTLPLFRNLQFGAVDGSGNNTVRFTAGSTSSIQGSGDYPSAGTGVELAAGGEATLAHIKLDIHDRWNLDRTVAAPTPAILSENTKVNVDETVVTLVDTNKVKSLRDLRGMATDETYQSLQGFDATVSTEVVRATQALSAVAPSDNYFDDAFGIRIATWRSIGLESSETTNLVRKGSKFEDLAQLYNSGESTLKSVKAVKTGSIANGSITLDVKQRPDDLSASAAWVEWSSATPMVNPEMGLADVNFKVDQSGVVTERGQIWVTKKLEVTGEAGSVLTQVGAGGLEIYAYNDGENSVGKVGTIHGTTSKNLITYQADLNYDGRVSMKDLAFLNAGAKAHNNGAFSGIYHAEVDANFDKTFNVADLAVLDADWGKTLHKTVSDGEGGVTRSFTGNTGANAISWTELSGNGGYTWSNNSFDEQSKLESAANFVATLDT